MRTHRKEINMKLKTYKWHYERLCWPRHCWALREIFNPWNWDSSYSPSYANSFINIFKNIRTFLMPWYKWRRLLLLNVINANGCKLINYSSSFSFMRTRGDSGDIVYYRLKCGIYRATLWREKLVEVKSEEPTTHFMAGLLCAFGKDRKLEDYREEREKVLSGPCLTRRQCERLLGRIVESTPDCGWFGLEG